MSGSSTQAPRMTRNKIGSTCATKTSEMRRRQTTSKRRMLKQSATDRSRDYGTRDNRKTIQSKPSFLQHERQMKAANGEVASDKRKQTLRQHAQQFNVTTTQAENKHQTETKNNNYGSKTNRQKHSSAQKVDNIKTKVAKQSATDTCKDYDTKSVQVKQSQQTRETIIPVSYYVNTTKCEPAQNKTNRLHKGQAHGKETKQRRIKTKTRITDKNDNKHTPAVRPRIQCRIPT